ncbi:YheC/YheD family protein [Mangrovibacillus cuniculi]|uniref:YheC/YheD family protein n=1 Tax=Mangrovibacillus cuniculi TaxID=2593652 RepID=A0A7S8C9R1_9BACI|nr:YheC/YheD family protein [Mangrovibacillus cuniculi]QPC45972.1 YheC/YheD family protein [Mangrovibacillus cuniculi]
MKALLSQDLSKPNCFHFTMTHALSKDSNTVQVLRIGTSIFFGEMKDENTFIFEQKQWKDVPTCLSHELHVSIRNNEIVVEPVLMILTDSRVGSANFTSYESFYLEMLEYGNSIGAVTYILPLTDYHLYKESKGFIHIGGEWKEEFVPLPTTVYNRVHNRKIDASQGMDLLRKDFQEKEIAFFNHQYVSKWEVHKVLSTEPSFRAYLPKTEYAQYECIYDFLHEKVSFFLKPAWGSLGKGIHYVEFNQNLSHWLITDGNKVQRYHSIQEACTYLDKLVAKSPHILQQKVSLVTYDDRPVDFRIHLIASTTSEFEVTSIIARVSAKNKIVSNLSQGGELGKSLNVLKSLFDSEKAKTIYSLMKELSIEMASLLSYELDGSYREFGIDMGVDVNGKPWLIECNIKPSKQQDIATGIRASTKAIWKSLFEREKLI